MKLAIGYDDIFLEHVDRGGHPERPERLVALKRALEEAGYWAAARHVAPREATQEELTRVHLPDYVKATLSYIEGGYGNLDPDTFYSPGTREAALKAAGGAVELARQVWAGEADVGLALVRPPGHHAEAYRAAGFCLFNNIAVAAAALLAEGVERILIYDWDVHHGNGTQHMFESRKDLLYISVHAWPHFPGTGLSDEIGEGEGEGYTANVPYPHGSSDADYAAVTDRILEPLADAFQPQIILVSLGFDGHHSDYLGGMSCTVEGFGHQARVVRDLAAKHCGGKVLLCLEGGYILDAITRSMVKVLRVLEGGEAARPTGQIGARQRQVLEKTLQHLRPYWPGLE